MSTNDLIAKLLDLDLNKSIDDEDNPIGVNAFLTAEVREYPTTSIKMLKSVACITSTGCSRAKSRSGWSAGSGYWVGHKVLFGDEMTSLVRDLARELSYTFKADSLLDAKGAKDYWPGRFQVCHAEMQLMAYYYYEHRSSNPDQASRGYDMPSETVDIHIYPRHVCRYSHSFAKRMFCMKGLQFHFYFSGKRDLPRCNDCEEIIQNSHFCPRSQCSRLELQRSTDTLSQRAVELRQCLKTSRGN